MTQSKLILDGKPRKVIADGIEWHYAGVPCGCFIITPASLNGESDEWHPRFQPCTQHYTRLFRHVVKHS